MLKRLFVVVCLLGFCGRGLLLGMKTTDTLGTWHDLIKNNQFDQFEKEFFNDSSPFTKELFDEKLFENKNKFDQVKFILSFIQWRIQQLQSQVPIVNVAQQNQPPIYIINTDFIAKSIFYQTPENQLKTITTLKSALIDFKNMIFKEINILITYAKAITINDLLNYKKTLNMQSTGAPLINEFYKYFFILIDLQKTDWQEVLKQANENFTKNAATIRLKILKDLRDMPFRPIDYLIGKRNSAYSAYKLNVQNYGLITEFDVKNKYFLELARDQSIREKDFYTQFLSTSNCEISFNFNIQKTQFGQNVVYSIVIGTAVRNIEKQTLSSLSSKIEQIKKDYSGWDEAMQKYIEENKFIERETKAVIVWTIVHYIKQEKISIFIDEKKLLEKLFYEIKSFSCAEDIKLLILQEIIRQYIQKEPTLLLATIKDAIKMFEEHLKSTITTTKITPPIQSQPVVQTPPQKIENIFETLSTSMKTIIPKKQPVESTSTLLGEFIKTFSSLEGEELWGKITDQKDLFMETLSSLHQKLYELQKKYENEVKKAEDATDTGTIIETEFKLLFSMGTIYSKEKVENIDKVKKENLPTLEKLKNFFSQKDFEYINEILNSLNNYLEINPYTIDLSSEIMAPPKVFSTLKKLENKIIDVKDIMLHEKIWKEDWGTIHYFRKQLQCLTGFNKINFGDNVEVKIQGFKELKDCFQESQQDVNEIIQFFIRNRNNISDINRTLGQSKKVYEKKIFIENEKRIISLINLYKLSTSRLSFHLSCDDFYSFVFIKADNKLGHLYNGITNNSNVFFYFFKKDSVPEELLSFVKKFEDITTYTLNKFAKEIVVLKKDFSGYSSKEPISFILNLSKNLVYNYFSQMTYEDSFGFFYGEKEINTGVFKQFVEKLYEFKKIDTSCKLQIVVSIMELIFEKIKSKTSIVPDSDINVEDLCTLGENLDNNFKNNTYFVYACSLFLKNKNLFLESFKNMIISYFQTKKIERQAITSFLNEIKLKESKPKEEIKIEKKLDNPLANALSLLKAKLLSLAKNLQA